jgi:hypothetical protein
MCKHAVSTLACTMVSLKTHMRLSRILLLTRIGVIEPDELVLMTADD